MRGKFYWPPYSYRKFLNDHHLISKQLVDISKQVTTFTEPIQNVTVVYRK